MKQLFLWIVFLLFINIFSTSKIFSQNNNIDKIILISTNNTFGQENEKNEIYKIGNIVSTSLNISNSGTILETENSKKWILYISIEGAKGLSIHFEYFKLKNESLFTIYNKERTEVLGPFTNKDNKAGLSYSIGIIYDEEIIIEYEIPKNEEFSIEDFNISGVAKIFIEKQNTNIGTSKALGFGSSDICNINVNCSEGENFYDEKRGIARIFVVDGSSVAYCTGTLINNTAKDSSLYILTAGHCGEYASYSDFQQWRFDFNYETNFCNEIENEPNVRSFTGCRKLAKSELNGGSDFLLLELTNAEKSDIAKANLVYNGWQLSNIVPENGVCIHHPRGDVKKISTFANTALTTTFQNIEQISLENAFWKLKWMETKNGFGVTDIGSSGAPLFNNNGYIIGTLSGGSSSCNNKLTYDYFAKFFYHWNMINSDSLSQLRYWLDPINNNSNSCELMKFDNNISIIEKEYLIFPNPCKNYLKISNSNNKNFDIYIYDILGNLIYIDKNIYKEAEINIEKLNIGIYLIKIINEEQLEKTYKIVKTQ